MGPTEVTATLGELGCIHLGPEGLIEQHGFVVDARDNTLRTLPSRNATGRCWPTSSR